MIQDLRHALRVLRQNAVFALVAILVLGIGIGATSAVFTQLNAVFWNPLPLRNPEELRTLSWTSPTLRAPNSFFYGQYVTLREKGLFGDIACAWKFRHAMGEFGLITFQLVSGNYLQMLGVRPVVGRMLTPEDDRSGDPSFVAVISYRFWKRNYGGAADVLGRTVKINGRPFEIVGVMAEGFAGLYPVQPREVMMPFASGSFIGTAVPQRDPKTWSCNELVGRVRPDISDETIRAQAQAVLDEALIANPSKDGKDARVVLTDLEGFRGFLPLRERASAPLILLLCTAGTMLLITCTNVAGLLLSRGHARQKELATRLAIGAPRSRIVRQLLTESLLLSIAGGAVGIALAYVISPGLPDLLGDITGRDWLNPTLTPGIRLQPDGRVLALTVVLALSTGIVFGLLPAFRATRVDLISLMKQTSAGSAGGHLRMRTGKTLVAVQVGLSMLLLIGTGLLVRTLVNLRSVPIGYDPNGLVFVMLDPARSPPTFIADTLVSLENMPGVTSAAVSQWPLYNNAQPRLPVCVAAQEPSEQGMDVEPVSPRFFETWGIRFVAGRDFDLLQDAGRNVIVNDKFVKTFYRNQNPLGQQIGIGKCPGASRTIVGVVADHLDRQRVEITPMVYVPYPYRERRTSPSTVAVRTSGDPAGLVSVIRRLMADASANVDGDVMLGPVYVEREWRKERLLASVLTFFGSLALLISCLGVYGLLTYTVTWRTAEVGIRMALGAERAAVMRLIIRESLIPVIAGVIFGLMAAFIVTRWLETLLFGVTRYDPAAIVVAATLCLFSGGLAAFWPARRASLIDPMKALRYE